MADGRVAQDLALALGQLDRRTLDGGVLARDEVAPAVHLDVVEQRPARRDERLPSIHGLLGRAAPERALRRLDGAHRGAELRARVRVSRVRFGVLDLAARREHRLRAVRARRAAGSPGALQPKAGGDVRRDLLPDLDLVRSEGALLGQEADQHAPHVGRIAHVDAERVAQTEPIEAIDRRLPREAVAEQLARRSAGRRSEGLRERGRRNLRLRGEDRRGAASGWQVPYNGHAQPDEPVAVEVVRHRPGADATFEPRRCGGEDAREPRRFVELHAVARFDDVDPAALGRHGRAR